MPSQKLWTAVLQCHVCNRVFTISGVLTDNLSTLIVQSQCPHCAAKSIIAPGPNWKLESKLHRLMDLREDSGRSN